MERVPVLRRMRAHSRQPYYTSDLNQSVCVTSGHSPQGWAFNSFNNKYGFSFESLKTSAMILKASNKAQGLRHREIRSERGSRYPEWKHDSEKSTAFEFSYSKRKKVTMRLSTYLPIHAKTGSSHSQTVALFISLRMAFEGRKATDPK